MKKLFKTKTKPAFNLTELLVVIFILALIGSLAIISFNEIRKSGRDSKRLADVSEIKMALESYKFFEGEYPSALTPGDPLVGPVTGNIYLDPIPSNLPYAEESCPYGNYSYTKESDYYTLSFCLEGGTGDYGSGVKCFVSASGKILDSSCYFTCGDTVSLGGYDYPTVQIGEKCWFAENLKYDNGCSSVTWENLIDKGWCGYYDNNPANSAYGLLYQWSAIMNGSTEEGAQGICPSGWRIPTYNDFNDTLNALGGESEAGPKMSSSPSDTPSWYGTNSTGFSAVGSGIREREWGWFITLDSMSYIWSSKSNSYNAYYLHFAGGASYLKESTQDPKEYAFSARCVKDIPLNNCSSMATCGEECYYQGKHYSTVQVGSQCWFAEDLQYDNGCSSKTYVNYTDVGWCSIPLYQWSAAMNNETTEGAQGLCPENWHVATLADFQTLSSTLGGDSVSGGKLKASSPYWDGSNEAGFNALPAGYIDGDGSSYYAGMFNFTHTSSVPYPGSSHYINMMGGISSTLYAQDPNDHARLVRCVKN